MTLTRCIGNQIYTKAFVCLLCPITLETEAVFLLERLLLRRKKKKDQMKWVCSPLKGMILCRYAFSAVTSLFFHMLKTVFSVRGEAFFPSESGCQGASGSLCKYESSKSISRFLKISLYFRKLKSTLSNSCKLHLVLQNEVENVR